MKKICLLILFASACQKTTEEKIKSALENNLRNSFSKNDEAIESLKINSINYSACSMVDFYQNKETQIIKSYTEIINEAMKYNMDSLVNNKMVEEDSLLKVCNEEIKKADKLNNLYEVNFAIEIKTNKNSFSSKMKVFLSQTDLSEVLTK
jgi:hypothetical protein